MTAQDNAVLARRLYGAFNRGDLDECLADAMEDVSVLLVPFGQTFNGREGFRAFMQGFRTAFPDIRLSVTGQIATAERVVNEFTWSGTHRGPLQTPTGEIPPTGKEAGYPVCEVWEMRNGKLAAIRNYQDSATLMRQLGLIS